MSGEASALSATASDVSRTKVDAYAALSSEQFVKIMFAELSNQDPLKPNDSSQLLQQMSSLRSIESDMQMQRKLESLVNQNQFASAGSLIGAYISGLDENNRRVEGMVLSVNRTAGGPVLNLANGARVPFGSMDEVIDPRLLQPPAPTPPNPGTTPPPAATPPRSDTAPTEPAGVE
ncbi:MAG: hypothetical protein KIT68_07630 [Phycisphaeraceae bacterium]|nr:hypothetical protein [Phycisphaeraceae bacterium]